VVKEALYLQDTIALLIDAARSASSTVEGSPKSGDASYQNGRTFGLMEAVSLLHQQMASLEMDPSQYGFPAGFDPERELLK
jgi:hypothetical protein